MPTTCPLCGLELYIAWYVTRPIRLSEDGVISDEATDTTWHIGCNAGHVILLPEDGSEEFTEEDALRLVSLLERRDRPCTKHFMRLPHRPRNAPRRT